MEITNLPFRHPTAAYNLIINTVLSCRYQLFTKIYKTSEKLNYVRVFLFKLHIWVDI